MNVSGYIAKQILAKIPMFDVLDSHVVGLIALKMRKISCNSGYKLFDVNDPAREMYIQRSGKSLLTYSDEKIYQMRDINIRKKENYLKYNNNSGNDSSNNASDREDISHYNNLNDLTLQQQHQRNRDNWIEFEQELERGSVAGELALAYNTRKYSLQCLTWCEFYVIEVETILDVLRQEYPRQFLV